MRVVCYAVNGSGIGHLKRLTAIARHLRKLSVQAAVPLEIFFLTSSEATHLLSAENFPSFKFPSREVLEKAEIETSKFAATVGKWTAATLDFLQPDLLLVDTFPAGYYGELAENLGLSKHAVIIHRPLKFDNLDREAFYRSIAHYDAVIIPEEKEKSEIELPPEIKAKSEYFGAVICGDKDALPSRVKARQELNLKAADFTVYLSAGGGGDRTAEQTIHATYKALSKLTYLQIVIGAGALYRGKRIYRENVIWLGNENVFSLMPAFDAGFSAAGYNSFHELLYAGVPTVFIPQKKWADDQFARAQSAVKAGAALLLESLPEPTELRHLIEKLRDEETRSRLSQNAKNFVQVNFAEQIARYLFEKFLFV